MEMIKGSWRICALCLVLVSSASVRIGAADAPIDVFVSIPPQAFFVERIGGERLDVHTVIRAGQSPHTFEPTSKLLAELAKAKIYFAIGFPFEKRLLRKIRGVNPDLRVVHTEGGVKLSKEDPHIWLSPRFAKIQAETIDLALAKADPENAKAYAKNLKRLLAELDRVDKKIAGELAPYKGRTFYVYHPAFGYFAAAYGLEQVSVEHEGKEPGASDLAAFIEGAKARGATVIFVEPQFPKRQAEVIAKAIGGKVVTLDPLAEDYLTNLETIAQKIRDALKTER